FDNPCPDPRLLWLLQLHHLTSGPIDLPGKIATGKLLDDLGKLRETIPRLEKHDLINIKGNSLPNEWGR
ncbi:hypothetical protein ACC754_44240, partial [Rhizobium johnstonii]